MKTRVIVTDEDLLPVTVDERTGSINCDGFTDYFDYTDTDPEALRLRGLRLLSISEELKKRANEGKQKLHEEWLIENILPLARLMHNAQLDETTSAERWEEYYHKKNHAVLRWVRSTEAVYKVINPEDADK